MRKTAEMLIFTINLIKEEAKYKERKLMDSGNYISAALFTGKIAAFNETVKLLKEIFHVES